MPELVNQFYQIFTVLHGNSATSVNGLIPLPTQLVRLGLDDRVWEIKKVAEDVYHFAIKDRYPYSGVEDNKVVATIDRERNVLWHVTHRPNSDAFTIERDDDREKVWTVASETDPESEIAIDKLKYLPLDIFPPIVSPTQLFKFQIVLL